MNLDVSRETYDLLRAYELLILKWNSKINLISATTEDVIRERHILDSLESVKIPKKFTKALDGPWKRGRASQAWWRR